MVLRFSLVIILLVMSGCSNYRVKSVGNGYGQQRIPSNLKRSPSGIFDFIEDLFKTKKKKSKPTPKAVTKTKKKPKVWVNLKPFKTPSQSALGSPSKTSTIRPYINTHSPSPYNVITSKKYWKVSFFDDFKGKPTNSSEDNYCYDELEPQCHIWAGSHSRNCARTLSNFNQRNYFKDATIPNIRAAIKAIKPNLNTDSWSLASLLNEYKNIIEDNQKHLNKCVWTNYEFVNWMATDYNGRWSAKFDPVMVKVKPEGKGYLELKAKKAPAPIDCAMGGTLYGEDCLLVEITDKPLYSGVEYWVDPNPAWAGIFYAKINGSCPYGGWGPVNCHLWVAPKALLETQYVDYFVKLSPKKGIYYKNINYRCKSNITYHNGVEFKNLNCPILNGGINSAYFKNYDDNEKERGFLQREGRYEVKFRIPKGKGAFPAAWLMPKKGGWPYSGGEIDVIEARDKADEVYQTYHHGKCFDEQTFTEILWKPTDPYEYIDSGDCKADQGYKSIHLHKGHTSKERDIGEFYNRDHIFAVEWDGNEIKWFTNNEKTNHIKVGTHSETNDPAQPGKEWEDLPSGGDQFEAHNFPRDPFYWILNHSTYVNDNYLAQKDWPEQNVLIDYVKVYEKCKTHQDFCPKGGTFIEGQGCRLKNGAYTAPACEAIDKSCPNGGVKEGNRCVVKTLNVAVALHVDYWIDSDPRWPGVYYKKINGLCAFGGTGSVNCQIYAFPQGVLEDGVDYKLDNKNKKVYYQPTFVNESSTTPTLTCPGLRKELGTFYGLPVCKALSHFEIDPNNCDGQVWNEYCIWNKTTWYRARKLKAPATCPWPRPKLGEYGDKAVCKAVPHFKIKESKCDGIKWSGYCIWDKGTWYRARQLK